MVAPWTGLKFGDRASFLDGLTTPSYLGVLALLPTYRDAARNTCFVFLYSYMF